MTSIIFATLMYFGCGMEPLTPLTPLGCKDVFPVCICDSKGQCTWQFQCIKD